MQPPQGKNQYQGDLYEIMENRCSGYSCSTFLNGCGKDYKDKIINPSMEDITAVSEVETTKNFTKNTYTGIDIRNKGEITNETGDVSRIGMNMYQSRINDKDFYFNDVAVRDGK